MKNIDFVIKKTAHELQLPEDKVKPIVMEYWRTIYHKILTGEATTITVRHVGTFTVSRWKLRKYIQKLIDKIRRIKKTENLTPENKKQVLEIDYKRLKNCLRHRNIVATEYL